MFEYIWAQKYRPQTLDDLILSDSNRAFFADLIEKKQIPHLLLDGPPGVGKTTLAKILVKAIGADVLYINASDEAGIDTIRTKVVGFAETRAFGGGIKVVILDEADGLSGTAVSGKSSAQQALRNVMEEYSANTRFILTANYFSKIMEAIDSRCDRVQLMPIYNECVKAAVNILKKEKVTVPDDQKAALTKLIKSSYPDMRKIVNSLQRYTIDRVLTIDDNNEDRKIAESILDKLEAATDLKDIRTFIIHNEHAFQNYHDLLTDLFEAIFNRPYAQPVKAAMLLIITEAMYRHGLVMDHEINCYSAVIQLYQLFPPF